MKVIAYTALHYGRDYLAYAIRSVIDAVDEYHVLYTSEGSHGHRNGARCPETREELYAIAHAAAGHKLHWHDGIWGFEGQQRDSIFSYAPDAAVIFTLDADEIWPASTVKAILDYAFTVTNSIPPFRILRVPMVHFWRSFNRVVLHDPAWPERVTFPHIQAQYGMQSWANLAPIAHFGYAQRPEIVEYKLKVHGHKNEFRTDCDWFRDVFMNEERRTDLHPVGSEYWNVEDINPWDYLPDWMAEHPYYELEVIE